MKKKLQQFLKRIEAPKGLQELAKDFGSLRFLFTYLINKRTDKEVALYLSYLLMFAVRGDAFNSVILRALLYTPSLKHSLEDEAEIVRLMNASDVNMCIDNSPLRCDLPKNIKNIFKTALEKHSYEFSLEVQKALRNMNYTCKAKFMEHVFMYSVPPYKLWQF